jgi:hypothetical protein
MIGILTSRRRVVRPCDTGRLVVEVLSPTTARAHRFTKRRLYQEEGIPTYWIVDPDAHFVEVWTPDAGGAGAVSAAVTL